MTLSCFFLILLGLPICEPQQWLSLVGRKTSQGSTIDNHEAQLAIDGNSATYALSATPHLWDNMAWWIVDLGGNYPVQSVGVTNPQNFESGVDYSLENFDIFVVSFDNFYRLCNRFNSGQFNFGETKIFQCSNGPLSGVSIYFKKLAGGVRNELALAEVFVYVSSSSGPGPSPSPLPSQIPVVVSSQSSTLDPYGSNLAVDNNPQTYSIALANGNNYAWWQADLGNNYAINKVLLITSPDYTSAQYLQSVSIDVSYYTSTYDPYFQTASNCNKSSSTTLLNPLLNLELTCNSVPRGRYVIVRRIDDNTYRPDVLSMAEAQIYGYRV